MKSARFEYLVVNICIAFFAALSMIIFPNNLEAGGFCFFILIITIPCHILVGLNKKTKGAIAVWGFILFVLLSGVTINEVEIFQALITYILLLSIVVSLLILFVYKIINKKRIKK
jgi:hypothetical protein